ncbi:CsbD family protein [Paraburkholderia panacisoli]|uniref:CsbD family protein n=1 Tax=Paraburkholderia panacisoli TaxID=2603818 RepID=A0A5B0GLC9_9BURK|nr:CsbD family protein [Paraburkholderia panacisoli]KAA1004303.1 CsbD family protein [Paraburkholderia panacisoli]
MNRDQVKGRVKEAKGQLKEMVGKVTGSATTRVKGRIEQVVGKTQATYGDAKEQFRKRS